ncbi:TBC1 domain family member 31 [Bactrocera neohumeralis]|uniref:TBC1 domain family member 31 n=1 Tax=Bactrocera tryoni TaxID=59916 RepID=UPI001A977839|nr:TBC1 domain family member 31 [Bactrocera tryoni]XP_039956191.1 TBC1 domain family member 31 [Bactrocera tryoni]XP_050324265.1 TBC1 domain family member 31 [Bactrocera neohumeralis]XP_050324266.1 TBC1 domain family member 31 [Bactrocera neohumeralis]
MENNGESADKFIRKSVNEENTPKNDESATEMVHEIINEIRDAAVAEAAEANAVKDNLNADVSAPSPENMEEDDDNPLASIFLEHQKELHDYPFRFKKSEKGNILSMHHISEWFNTKFSPNLKLCTFNSQCSIMVVVAEIGLIYIFDLVNKSFRKLSDVIFFPSAITPWGQRRNHFLIGNSNGEIALLDLDKSTVTQTLLITKYYVMTISCPPPSVNRQHLVLVHCDYEVILFDVEQFVATRRFPFRKKKFQLKFSGYFSQSDHIFNCFNDDTVQIWSGATMNTIRAINPIKMRDRKLRMEGAGGLAADFLLCQDYNGSGGVFNVDCKVSNHSNGMIIGYCFHPNMNLICLSTRDGYLLLIDTITFDLKHICRLQDFVIRHCVFLLHPKEIIICGVTDRSGEAVVLNCLQKDIKLRIQSENAARLTISSDAKYLVIFNKTGELDVWSTSQIYNILKSQEECLRLIKLSFRQNKPLLLGPSRHCKSALVAAQEECLNEDIRNLLSRDRLLSILREFRWFPCKYRVLIWCALLQLPYNRNEFFQLLKMGTPPIVKQRAKQLPMRDGTLKNALVRIWSCLAHWCPVFAHSKFLPQLIFPFVKLMPRNSLVVFEICVTLLTNHFQMWFELHPLEPNNYLGMCENLLQSQCSELCKFYASMHINSEHYAWSLLSSVFSEVFSQTEWLYLWDNILSAPPYYPIFIVVAYNYVQRRVIMRLPDKPTILTFFHEQNPVDVCEVINLANSIMEKCPKTLHPERYMPELQCIPKKVYPKFLNYPRQWLAKHEKDIAAVQREKQCIDARIRKLELEEMKLMERLQSGLRREEHAKQVKKMEKLYRDSLKREEERLACQRQMLAVYQKELRNRKAEVAVQVQESEQRQRALAMEKDLELLVQSIECERTRNDADLRMAEEELRNEEMELFMQKCLTTTGATSLRTKYHEDLQRLCNERHALKQQVIELTNMPKGALSPRNSNNKSHLDTIEEKIEEIQREFNEILNN